MSCAKFRYTLNILESYQEGRSGTYANYHVLLLTLSGVETGTCCTLSLGQLDGARIDNGG